MVLATVRPGAVEAQEAAFQLVLWFGGVIVAVLAAIIVLLYLRRRFLRSSTPSGTGFTLETIKGMRDRGELSPEEFDNLRRNLLGIAPEPAKKNETLGNGRTVSAR